MLRSSLVLVLVLVSSLAIAAQGQKSPSSGSPDAEMTPTLFTPSEIKWTDGPPSLPKGAKIAVLEGDPGKEGPFVFRVKVPDGYRVPPHTHPKVERITVIEGTF